MPTLLPFRALRFSAAEYDLGSVLSPPYDIISPAERVRLLDQHPHNAVRLDLPADLSTATAADYRLAADTLADWRATGVLVMDEAPTVTIHEMSWPDADGRTVSATGFFARLKLEEYGPGAGVLPHERTLSGPKQDRYDLLEATQLNTSPMVFLAGSEATGADTHLDRLKARPVDAQAATGDGVHHRVWIRPSSDDDATALLRAISVAPITIADGHHRYETALTFRRDRRAAHPGAADPAWDYVLALIYPLDQAPPVLPTHRVVSGGPVGAALLKRLASYAAIETLPDAAALLARMAEPVHFAPGASGTGRFGCYSDGQAALLTVRQASLAELLDAALSAPSRGLDVNVLTAIIEQVYGADPDTLVSQARLAYSKDAADAVGRVVSDQADTALLLHPMPAAAISDVAEAGEVMPQKSTYFNPKAPTGLVFGPLEW